MTDDVAGRLECLAKGPWPTKVRSYKCVICLEPIPVADPHWRIRLRDPVFDDEYLLMGDNFTSVEQVVCGQCRNNPHRKVSLPWYFRVSKIEGPRCEFLLTSGRRCRATAYVKFWPGPDQDLCPKHKPANAVTM